MKTHRNPLLLSFPSSALAVVLAMALYGAPLFSQESSLALPPPANGAIRIATFNVSLHRKALGELSRDLKNNDAQVRRLATIIQAVSPDILLANEVDYDGGESAELLLKEYFGNSKGNTRSLKYVFTSEVNTGVPSGIDIDKNGRLGGPNDAFGFGEYPGQYGMAVFSRYPILKEKARSFQKLLWSEMPGALRPMNQDGTPYWSDEIWNQLRLSSKTHLDVPIEVDGKQIHIIASHPTPPVFDKLEDKNGRRNHDEIRLLLDYISGGPGTEYLRSDQGTVGPLDSSATFVVLGDLNADPNDGSGRREGIHALLKSPRINSNAIPRSLGAEQASAIQGKKNKLQKGDPAEDTGDFGDNEPGNLRCDFVLPSKECKVVASGVYWPTVEQLQSVDKDLLNASDHRLVWIDIQLP
ncbi:MAG: endonuclease/exonuclease/phosphatase family protein [Pirellulaceae bacterium]|nr:endonuclease/exonuclease/phosphatase family protein [Pirellulaceae bacterium]